MSQETSQEKFVSSKEGASLLGVDRQSFFYYVESRGVQRREVVDGGKDTYEYSYDDLLKIKDDVQSRRANRKRNSKAIEKAISRTDIKILSGETDWCLKEDLPYIYAMDCEVYGIEYSVPPTKTIQWWQKNQTAIRVIFNKENRRDIWGCITLLPMKEETIIDILKGDKSEQEINAEDILPFELGKTYSCYVASCVIRPEHKSSFEMLFNSVLNYWIDHPEIHIEKLYGFAVGASEDLTAENDGLRLVKKLFFSPRYDIDDNAWELNLDRYNPSPLIQRYQKQVLQKRKEMVK